MSVFIGVLSARRPSLGQAGINHPWNKGVQGTQGTMVMAPTGITMSQANSSVGVHSSFSPDGGREGKFKLSAFRVLHSDIKALLILVFSLPIYPFSLLTLLVLEHFCLLPTLPLLSPSPNSPRSYSFLPLRSGPGPSSPGSLPWTLPHHLQYFSCLANYHFLCYVFCSCVTQDSSWKQLAQSNWTT